eukprot:gnl/Spiro4/25755_TR12810_c0_g1_i1.p1 gnl/Spiro4/25755_TR12810_c0_g1~~gnl/Spiro4/25755_TR12810_c0_g1_i1.p1  ORF type:complete len:143 (+),score=43.43 gnl/Spiro4/25755_TR12810_c0_g1_i1:27-431(+)
MDAWVGADHKLDDVVLQLQHLSARADAFGERIQDFMVALSSRLERMERNLTQAAANNARLSRDHDNSDPLNASGSPHKTADQESIQKHHAALEDIRGQTSDTIRTISERLSDIRREAAFVASRATELTNQPPGQ